MTLIILISVQCYIRATHNRAGEITFVQTGALSFDVTVTLYTKTSSVSADRDSIEIFWGDGTKKFLKRANGWGNPQPNDIKINYYTGSHTFPSRGTFTMSITDPNRIAGILNINFPDSELVPFYLETTFTILNNQFEGENNSAVLLEPPIDIGCVGQVYKYNPNVYDPDGDSIAYELIIPLQAVGTLVPDYKYPQSINPGTNNNFSLDQKTGDIIWNSPQLAGEYNIAFLVKEFRNGKLITSIIRDMQILIIDKCKSKPPKLSLVENKCVISGDTLIVPLLAEDPDEGQKIIISGSGAPFGSEFGYAYIRDEGIFKKSPFSTDFIWQTACQHAANTGYQILFKAMDNSITDTSGLTDLRTLIVKVSAPPPLNLNSEIVNENIRLSWNYPYSCSGTENGFFEGFSVWRKENSNNFRLDTCMAGLEGKGYQKIEYLTSQNDAFKYFYIDNTTKRGIVYCYRILAEFAHKTDNNFPYNPVSSLAGNESCIERPDNTPRITKSSIKASDDKDGQIEVNWVKPPLIQFDTTQFMPPYIYRLYMSNSVDRENFIEINDALKATSIFSQIDTFKYIIKNVDTKHLQYFFKVKLTSSNLSEFNSKEASTPYLDATLENGNVNLKVNYITPWLNQRFDFYRASSNDGNYQFIGSSGTPDFSDVNVENGQVYCYKVLTEGMYSGDNFKLKNLSQTFCITVNDEFRPCIPKLTVTNQCTEGITTIPTDDLYNYLSWIYPPDGCKSSDKSIKYYIYFRPFSDSVFQRIMTIEDQNIKNSTHLNQETSGCYYITAVDSSGLESYPSEIICKENCPFYILPNIFTPNGDGDNDIFHPIYRRHIDHIYLDVFNHWGIKVFETHNPQINWDGKDMQGNRLSPGTYYYYCKPYTSKVALEKMSGFIEIMY